MKYSIEWLQAETARGTAPKFLHFWGHTPKPNEEVGKACLSQWFESPFTVDGATYPTAEHWMMVQKARLFGDAAVEAQILAAPKPGDVKKLGRKIQGFDEISWVAARYDIVRAGNLHKFGQHPALANYLKQTAGRVIVEASPVDAIWGIGLAQDDPRATTVETWRGLNLLGFALMEVRDELLAG